MGTLSSLLNIAAHLVHCRKVIGNPVACAKLFMERSPEGCQAELRFGSLRFQARKQDMNPVREVLVAGCYDFILPYLQTIAGRPSILDFGANIGSFALKALSVRPDAKIVSVEAARDTFELLYANALRSGKTWNCIHAALWSHDGVLSLRRNGNSESNSVCEAHTDAPDTVPALRYASVLTRTQAKCPDLIKMDIEGAETAVIPEAAEELDPGAMIIELHKNISDPSETCRILANKFPFAYVSHAQPGDGASPNVVYCLSKTELAAPGMTRVNLMDHLLTLSAPRISGR